MKLTNIKFSLVVAIVLHYLCATNLQAQTSPDLSPILVQKNLITQREADSIAVLAAFNDKVNVQNKSFTIGLEFRPRFEYRDGYKQLPNDTSHAAFFATQRSRLYFTYTQPKFKFHTSIQDVRVWGQYGLVSTTGSLSVYEAYAEFYFSDKWFVRAGRQKIELDNGRLFSASNWSQAGKAHDGLDFIYNGAKVYSEFITCFNQTSEQTYETNFSPTTFTNYKLLNIHFLKVKLHKYITLTTLNAADGYQSKTSSRTLYERGTSGGRIAFEKGNLYATVCGYYQYGKLQSGKTIDAYYLQPEVQIKFKKLTTRLGAEYMSGDDATKPSDLSKSFVPLYGVAWKFMGNMDYFASFPTDVKKGGLFNPYLFLIFEINKNLFVRSDVHLFYLQNKVTDANSNVIDPYLGIENDLSLNYKWNDFTTIDFGFSYLFAGKSMETLKGGNRNNVPISGYLMLTFQPEIFSLKK
ncbi:hypothetical protein BH09BAC5_BH09BAC5_18730 [soil metagenome]